MFCRSSKSNCLNEEAEDGERTVVYEKIDEGGPDKREVSIRVARDITETIDPSELYANNFVLKLPGEIMNGDDQCVLQYGLDFRQCSRFAVRDSHLKNQPLIQMSNQCLSSFRYFFSFLITN